MPGTRRYFPWPLTARQQYRLLEIAPGLVVWLTLLLALLLALLAPLWAIIFILVFDVFWFIRVGYVMLYVLFAFRQYRRAQKESWPTKLEEFSDWRKVLHIVMLPTYKEPLVVLEGTFAALARSQYPLDRLWVVLATEERDAERARANAAALQAKYGQTFGRLLVMEHPDGMAGEIASKGANIAYAGRQLKTIIDQSHIPYEDILVSTFDADSVPHPAYFAHLSWTFLSQPDRLRCSYQPIPVFHNNVWEALFLMRVVANSTTFWLLSETLRADRLFTFSSHSLPWSALVDVDFWQTDVVNEDSRIFVQCYLHYDGHYRVTPIYLPISMDTVQGENLRQNIFHQYKQIQRWAYGGVENFPFTVWNFLKNRSIPLTDKLRYTWIQMEGIYSWATAPLLILLLGWLPFAVASPALREMAIVQNAPAMIQGLMGLAMIGLIVSAVLSTVMLPHRPSTAPWYRWVMMVGQWFFLPVTMILFGSLPAIDAQTRMMLGKYMGFVVTEKTRQPQNVSPDAIQ